MLRKNNLKKLLREKIKSNKNLSIAIELGESLDIIAIYAFKGFLQKFLQEVGKYFVFPGLAAASVIQAVLAWKHARLDGCKQKNIIRALVETGTATAISIAVIGALVAETTFVLATPLIFSVTSANKALFHLVTSAYYSGKSAATPDLTKKDKRFKIAVSNGVASAAYIVATIALICVFLLGKTEVAGLGIALGLSGVSYALYRAINQTLEVPEIAYQLIPDNDASRRVKRNKLLINEELTTRNIFERLDVSSDEIRISLYNKSKKALIPLAALPRSDSTPHPKPYYDLNQKKLIEAYRSRSRSHSI